MKTLLLAIRLMLWACVLAVPVLGVWTASSLAAYWHGEPWLTLLAGALLFPVLPLTWDLFATWRKRRKEAKRRAGSSFLQDLDARRRRVLGMSFADRMLIRTLVLNGAFLGLMLSTWPSAAFTALSARGDWMLDRSDASWAPYARTGLFTAADSMAWLYELANPNPYEDLGEATDILPEPGTGGTLATDDDPDPDRARSDDPDPDRARSDDPDPDRARSDDPDPDPHRWPFAAQPHHLVGSMPPEAKESIAAVGAWIAHHERDPFQRVKALHDFAATHVAYDYDSLEPGRRKPQDAETVFASGLGVCAGYANLMVALGEASGDEIVYLVGDVREADGGINASPHAWNAARIEDAWYLLDATWDAGYRGEDDAFQARYRTDYLLTPPDVFRQDHLPNESRWQLVEPPMDRGDFTRQLMLEPAFYAAGLVMTSPTRSQVTVGDRFDIHLENPRDVSVLATWKDSAGQDGECEVKRDGTRVTCAFPRRDSYSVTLFTAHERYTTHWSVGQIQVNADPGRPGV